VEHGLDPGLGFGKEEIADCLSRGGLLSLELEFTRKCNLRCVYCYSSAGDALPGEMSCDRILDVVRQAKDLGARKIILLGGGEPLLYPGFREIVLGISALGLSMSLFTNGVLLTPDDCRFLFESRVNVVVKKNSFDAAVQDDLAGVPGAHIGIARGLRLLQETGYPGEDRLLGIQSIICRETHQEIVPMWVWARERGITPYFEVLTCQGRAAENRHMELAPGMIQELFCALARIDVERFGIRWDPRPPIAAFTCRRHLYSCLVNSQGYVQACTGIDLPLGNVNEKPLARILEESEVIHDLRNVYERIAPECRACGHGGECYGCRGNAYQLTGDYLSRDPFCWLPRKVTGKIEI
jgi:radical SAM protein with 4Fe4S-binding SPASM domain